MLLQIVIQLEQQLSTSLGWPSWALRIIFVLTTCVIATSIMENVIMLSSSNRNDSTKVSNKSNGCATMEFRLFQLQYLGVYLTIMLADWLQGTNMYTLYSSYGVNVGTLFLTGFLSSAIFGTFLGIYVDTYGRKLGCIIFCLLEIVINILEHLPNMHLLMFGRILGGMSTSLLFTAFESWMVSEHRKRGFDDSLLASTFAISSWGNGFVAILAGFLAQGASDLGGDIGPFQLAIALTIITLVPICFWKENYGSTTGNSGSSKEQNETCSIDSNGKVTCSTTEVSMLASMKASINFIIEHPSVLCLGLSQACFEGAIYTFVFMWVPSLLIANKGSLPTGLVFSAFMLAMTLGGMLFGILLPIFPRGVEGLCILVYFLAACSMAVPIICFDFWYVLVAFLLLEAMVGMFNSCGGTLRSIYYPEGLQSSIMSVFRLPLNMIVVIGTKLTDQANEIPSLQYVFGVLVTLHLIAMAAHIALILSKPSTTTTTSNNTNTTTSNNTNTTAKNITNSNNINDNNIKPATTKTTKKKKEKKI